MAIDYTPMLAAGLTKTEFASLLGITRVTVHRWVEDGGEPTPYLRDAVTKLLGELQVAIDNKLLPGELEQLEPSRYTKDERRAAIDNALRQVRGA